MEKEKTSTQKGERKRRRRRRDEEKETREIERRQRRKYDKRLQGNGRNLSRKAKKDNVTQPRKAHGLKAVIQEDEWKLKGETWGAKETAEQLKALGTALGEDPHAVPSICTGPVFPSSFLFLFPPRTYIYTSSHFMPFIS